VVPALLFEIERRVAGYGTIEATTVDLNAKAAGTLQKLSIKAGDSVTPTSWWPRSPETN
jgi:multidrug efflux pump subunit AcrA (membrane-fusion protein)